MRKLTYLSGTYEIEFEDGTSVLESAPNQKRAEEVATRSYRIGTKGVVSISYKGKADR